MVKVPDMQRDPLLDAIDAAMEKREQDQQSFSGNREHLGASGIGHPCERKSWLDFRWASKRKIPAKGLRAIEDGHRGEYIMAERIRLVDGVTLVTHEANGKQIGFADHGGHFRGSLDGMLTGLPQAPKTKHVWESKVVNQKKFEDLQKLKRDWGEKEALKRWDIVYYSQAQLYMHYLSAPRHYLNVGSPGVREMTSCRTDYDADVALRLVAKAKRVISAAQPPARISDDPAWFECRFCPHWSICHEPRVAAESNCRTCLHSTPRDDGSWHCARFNILLDAPTGGQDGCPSHLFVPALVPGEQTDAGDDWVEYRLRDGTVWRDEKKA